MKLLAAPKGGTAGKFLPDCHRKASLNAVCTIEEIHLRAETVTPLLRDSGFCTNPALGESMNDV